MRLGTVDFPEELIRAREDGRLVVFAGAGVSMGEPACLPSFEALAKRIGGGGELTEEEKSRLDWYLGQLAKSGVDVHGLAEHYLNEGGRAPNELHSNLLKLFEGPSNVRIVTTNFDLLFEDAAQDLWGETPPVFTAPALPIGSGFRGIVHLHGRLQDPSCQMILTDSDFGRAYLTQGWARRFLADLFPAMTVLFVGYRHSEPVIRYLALGLPAEAPGKRFALIGVKQESEKDKSEWRYLGVDPIRYEVGDDHEKLYEAIADWAGLINHGALDHKTRLSEILRGDAGLLDSRDESFIDWCLDRRGLRQYFFQAANGTSWFEFVTGGQRFDRLRNGGDGSDTLRRFGYWISVQSEKDEEFGCKALAWLGELEALPSELWDALLRLLDRAYHEPIPGHEQRRLEWLAFLLARPPKYRSSRQLGRILSSLEPAEMTAVALLLSHLLEPQLVVRSDSRLFGWRDISVEIPGKFHQLNSFWQQRGRDLLRADSFLFLNMAEERLRAGNRLWNVSEASDRWNLFRPLVSSHDELTHDQDVLIDIARDAMTWSVENAPRVGVGRALSWVSSDVPLLKRIGIYALTASSELSPRERIDLVLSEQLFHGGGPKPEAETLVEQDYPELDQSGRERLLGDLREAFGANSPEEVRPPVALWRFLKRLSRVAPGCPLVQAEQERILQQHPVLSERPDPAPFNVPTQEEIKSLTAEELFDALRVATGDWSSSESKRGEFLDRLREALTNDFAYSIKLAKHLGDGGAETEVLWRQLLRVWREVDLGGDEWARVNDLLVSRDLADLDSSIADLIEEKVDQAKDERAKAYADEALPLARLIFERSSRTEVDDGNWWGLAINRPVGAVAQFVLAGMRAYARTHPDDWVERAADYFGFAEKLLVPGPNQSDLACPVLASSLSFFLYHSPEWAQNHVLPLFDWETDTRRAAQAWDGFLSSGRLHQGTWVVLQVHYMQLFERANDGAKWGMLSNKLAEQMAGVAFYLTENPLEEEWFVKFLQGANDDQRIEWTRTLGRLLGGAGDDRREDVWERWIKDYLEQRLVGHPPLGAKEWDELFDWVVYLHQNLDEAVNVFIRKPLQSSRDSLTDLCDSHRDDVDVEALFAQPRLLAKLLRHMWSSMRTIGHDLVAWDEPGLLLSRLREHGLPEGELRPLANLVIELGGELPEDLEKALRQSS